MKIFNEALSVFNKFFPSVPSKKRSRSEGFPSDRSGAMLSSDRPGAGPSMGKIGIQNHYSIQGGFELDQKSEERTKTTLPNKRTRTSFVDAKVYVINHFRCASFAIFLISRPRSKFFLLLLLGKVLSATILVFKFCCIFFFFTVSENV